MDDAVLDDHGMTDLLHEAVADIEPANRLAELRGRTAAPSRRRGWWVVGGAVLATAAVVTGFAVLGNRSQPHRAEPANPSPTTTVSTPPASVHVVPVYYLGATPMGSRLYREFEQGTGVYQPLESLTALAEHPADPDYSTVWAPGDLTAVALDSGVIRVTLGSAALHDRPAGVSTSVAELSVQQVVYTVQAAYQQPLPVQFVLNGNPIDQVLGVATSEPLARAPQLDVLSLVSISDPSEGRVVTGSFTARGVAASFEGTVPWQLLDASGTEVAHGFAQGEMADHLTPWQTRVDVSGLAPGRYTFVAMTDDQSGGQSGDPGPFRDTRTVVVQ